MDEWFFIFIFYSLISRVIATAVAECGLGVPRLNPCPLLIIELAPKTILIKDPECNISRSWHFA